MPTQDKENTCLYWLPNPPPSKHFRFNPWNPLQNFRIRGGDDHHADIATQAEHFLQSGDIQPVEGLSRPLFLIRPAVLEAKQIFHVCVHDRREERASVRGRFRLSQQQQRWRWRQQQCGGWNICSSIGGRGGRRRRRGGGRRRIGPLEPVHRALLSRHGGAKAVVHARNVSCALSSCDGNNLKRRG